MRKVLFCFACLLCVLFTLAAESQTAPAGNWSRAGSLTSSRTEAAAATLRDGRVLITGGSSSGNALASAEIYDGKTFTATPSMSIARSSHAAAVLSDGRVVVSGGYSTGGAITNSIETYDPASHLWTAQAGMVTARAGHTMTRLNDGRLLIAGGMGSAGPLATLEICDLTKNSCTVVAGSMSSARTEHAAALLASGAVALAGGFDGTNVLNTVDAYDPKTDALYGPREMASARKDLTATTLLDGRVLLAGGNDGTQDLASLEIVDLVGGTIAAAGSLSVPRSGQVAMVLPNNGAVLIAGGTSNGTPISSAELFTPASSAVRSAGNMSVARVAAVAGGDPTSGHIVVAGGETSGSPSTGDLYSYPTISTDKPDYAPNTTVKITGTGWTPGETVTLVLHEQPTGDPDVTLTAQANSSGSFTNTQFKPDIHDQQIHFVLTAKGQTSGVFAQTMFSDSTYATQLSSPLPTSGAGGSFITVSAQLEYGVPQYQPYYYQYVCGSYSCNCGWGGCDTCYDYCTGYYEEYVGTSYYVLPGQTVQFSFNTGSAITAVTDSNGNATNSILVPPGASSLTATFAGSSDGTYGPSTAVSNFTLTQLPALTVTAINAVGTYGQPLPPLTYAITGFLDGDTQSSATTGAPAEGTAASSASTPGVYAIAISQGTLASTNYSLTFANGTLTMQQAPSTVTVSSLDSAIYPNQSTPLTATVSVAGSGAAPSGSVNFMSGATLLGTTTLTPMDATDSTATLNINGSQLTAGPNSITAVYSGDPNYGGSTSTAIIVTLLSPQVRFGAVNVGTAASVQTLTYSFSAPATLAAVNIVTEGASGLDYTDGGSTTCTAGSAYTAGQTCVVSVAFTASAPGLRAGAVAMFAQGSSRPMMTWYLSGIGQSGAVTMDPGTQSTIATLTNNGQASAGAIDGTGNIYVVDHANSQVIKLAAGSFSESAVVSSGLLNPSAAALDGAGNLYISDTGNSRVVMVPNEQGTLQSADMSPVTISGLGSPQGLAVDGGGNLYVVDSTNGNVIEVPVVGGSPITFASGLTSPQGIAVDAAGNVYVSSSNQVSQYPAGGGSPTPVGSGYINPTGVAVDASGAVFVSDSGNARIVRVAAGSNSESNLPVAGLVSPLGVLLDAAGNAYILDSANVYEVNRTQAAPLAFASTNVASTSAAQTVTVSNSGNQLLNVSNLALTANFTQLPSGGTDCTSSTQLSSSGQCLVAMAFAPTTSGPLAGTFSLTDNALNNSASTQSVALSGNATQVSQTITFPAISVQTYGVAPLGLSATASSGLPVSYQVISGPANVSGNVLTITGAGSVSVQASQSGNIQYAAASPVSETFAVLQATPNITWSNPADITYGTPLSGSQLNATSSLPGTFAYSPAAGTILGAGTQTLTAVFTPVDTIDFATVSATVQINVAKATPIITWNNPADITYPAALSSTQLNASILPAGAVGFWPFEEGSGTTTENIVASDSATLVNGASWAPGQVGASLLLNGGNQYADAGNTADLQLSQNDFTVTAWVYFNGIAGDMSIADKMLDRQNANDNGWRLIKQGNNHFWFCIGQQLGVNSCIGQLQSVTVATTGVWYHVAATKTANTLSIFVNGVEEASTSTGPINDDNAGDLLFGADAVQSAFLNGQIDEVMLFSRALSNTEIQNIFNGTQSAHGSFTYAPSAGAVLSAAAGQTLSATFNPTDTTDFNSATQTVSINVLKGSTVITWPTPSSIAYGTALGAAQLNATANVPGNFVYNPPAGTVLNAGVQTLAVTFAPADSSDYTGASASVSFTVTQASQTITFPAIATQTYGAAPITLGATASSSLPVSYTVTAGPANVSGNTLTITGTGSVSVQASQMGNSNYLAAAPVSQTFMVNPAQQVITFTQSAPSVAPYGASFSVVATSSSGLPVSFSSSGVCTNVGPTFTMTNSTGGCLVTASQAGNSNYQPAVNVIETTIAAKAEQLVVFTGAPSTAFYQSNFTLSASSSSGIKPTITVSGPCSISGLTVTMTSGTGTCISQAKWPANSYYLATSVTQSTAALKLPSTVTWSAPAAITYGTVLSAAQLNATASVAGKFVYSPAAGTVLKAGSNTLKVTFTPTLSNDYTTVTDNVVIDVNQATPFITWPTPAAISYGTPLSATQLNATANVPGKFVYAPASGKVLATGTQTLSVTFTPTDATDYTKATGSVTLVVNKAGTKTTLTGNSPNPSKSGGAVTVHFSVTGSFANLRPTGSVTVEASTGEVCSGTLSAGAGSCQLKFNSPGVRALTANYGGDSNDNSSVSLPVNQTVN